MTPAHRVLCAGSMQTTPFLERLAPAAAAGFTAVTVWPGDVVKIGAEKARAAAAEHGLSITDVECVGNWLPGHATAQGGWADVVRSSTTERLIALAVAVGGQTVSVVDLLDQPWDPVAVPRAFAEICDRAAEHGLAVAIEFVPVGVIPGVARAVELIERAGRPNAGIMVDSWHFFRSGSDLDALARVPGELILSIQLNDATALAEHDLNEGMVDRLMPGEGELDLRGLMQALAATGTRAPVGIEVFSRKLATMDAATAARACGAALDHCMEMVR